MTYYLKYRSQRLDELDLKDVRESLKKIVASGKIPHAFIFAGPKGTGKTSAARIIAKVVNCEDFQGDGEPCNRCKQCVSISKGENIDVIELDAASHRGIDDVRTLREGVKLAAISAKKKVYIIDEAHMLTTEASNALLKTLEEPPGHVMFILATTNPEKLIETIRSRSTMIVFRKAKVDELLRSLERIVAGEKIKVEKKVLEAVAKVSDGSFRDAAKLLEQIVAEKVELTEEGISAFLYGRRVFDTDAFLKILAKREAKNAIKEIERVMSVGMPIRLILNSLIERLRQALLFKIGLEGDDLKEFSKDEIVQLIRMLTNSSQEVPTAVLEQIPLELVIVEWCSRELKTGSSNSKEILEASNKISKSYDRKSKDIKKTSHTYKGEQISNFSKASHPNVYSSMPEELWLKVLTNLRPKNVSTEALLRAARPIKFDGETLTLGVYYKFHKEQLETPPHKGILEKVIEEVVGGSVRVVCTLTDPPIKTKSEEVILTEPDSDFGKAFSKSDTLVQKTDSVLTDDEDEDIIKAVKEIFDS